MKIYIVLLILLVYAKADRTRRMITKEMLTNHFTQLKEAGQLQIESARDIETEPINTEEKLMFWSGFIDSLLMIFFVEFGYRVLLLFKGLGFYDYCSLYDEAR